MSFSDFRAGHYDRMARCWVGHIDCRECQAVHTVQIPDVEISLAKHDQDSTIALILKHTKAAHKAFLTDYELRMGLGYCGPEAQIQ